MVFPTAEKEPLQQCQQSVLVTSGMNEDLVFSLKSLNAFQISYISFPVLSYQY